PGRISATLICAAAPRRSAVVPRTAARRVTTSRLAFMSSIPLYGRSAYWSRRNGHRVDTVARVCYCRAPDVGSRVRIGPVVLVVVLAPDWRGVCLGLTCHRDTGFHSLFSQPVEEAFLF